MSPPAVARSRCVGSEPTSGRCVPIVPNGLWALDFQFDVTADGRTLKMLNVIDEFTREALAIEVDRSRSTPTVSSPCSTDSPSNAAARRRSSASTTVPSSSPTPSPTGAGSTTPTRCSSTPAARGRTPGSSRSTAASATSCSTAGSSTRLLEARVIIEDWRIDYNLNRPHTAHGDLTPTEFAAHWTTINQPQAA